MASGHDTYSSNTPGGQRTAFILFLEQTNKQSQSRGETIMTTSANSADTDDDAPTESQAMMAASADSAGSSDATIHEGHLIMATSADSAGSGHDTPTESPKIITASADSAGPLSDTATLRTCIMCGRGGAKVCGSCGMAEYCSKECQRADWNLHKRLCSQAKTFVAGRPSPEHRSAILLPVDELQPVLIWYRPQLSQPDDSGDLVDYFSFQEYLGRDLPCPRHNTVYYNTRRDLPCDHGIVVTNRDELLFDGSTLNKCIVSCAEVSFDSIWKGPVVLAAVARDRQKLQDIRISDLRLFIDSVVAWRPPGSPDHFVTAVAITCHGDSDVFEWQEFEKMLIPPFTEYELEYGFLKGIPQRIGLSISMKRLRVPMHMMTADERADFSRRNDFATSLYLDVVDGGDGTTVLHSVRERGVDDCGPTVLVRTDLRKITVRQVEALCMFCHGYVRPLFRLAGIYDFSYQQITELITPQIFAGFFASYRSHLIREDFMWENEVCPV